MSAYYVGGEDAYYEPSEEGPCPCIDGGLAECYCGSTVSLDDARDWLVEQGVDPEGMYADEVIAAIDERHAYGFEGFHDEVAARKASQWIRQFQMSRGD